MKILKIVVLIAAILSVFSFFIFGLYIAVLGGMWELANGGGRGVYQSVFLGLSMIASGILTALILSQNKWKTVFFIVYLVFQTPLSVFISLDIMKETNFSSQDVSGPFILYGALFMVNSGWMMALWKLSEKIISNQSVLTTPEAAPPVS